MPLLPALPMGPQEPAPALFLRQPQPPRPHGPPTTRLPALREASAQAGAQGPALHGPALHRALARLPEAAGGTGAAGEWRDELRGRHIGSSGGGGPRVRCSAEAVGGARTDGQQRAPRHQELRGGGGAARPGHRGHLPTERRREAEAKHPGGV